MLESKTSHTFPVQTGRIFYFPWHRHHRRDGRLLVSPPDLGRFRLRSRNQTTIPTPIPESESFVVRFGGVGIGVGIVVIGIGVGIVVSGIGVGIGIRLRFHTFMYTVPSNIHQEVSPRKLVATKLCHTESETQPCENSYVCLG